MYMYIYTLNISNTRNYIHGTVKNFKRMQVVNMKEF